MRQYYIRLRYATERLQIREFLYCIQFTWQEEAK